jgi:hypothetical protein
MIYGGMATLLFALVAFLYLRPVKTEQTYCDCYTNLSEKVNKAKDHEILQIYNNGKVACDTMPRMEVSAIEILCECLGYDVKWVKNSDARGINEILRSLPGWKETKYRCEAYGQQRGFKRIFEHKFSGTNC